MKISKHREKRSAFGAWFVALAVAWTLVPAAETLAEELPEKVVVEGSYEYDGSTLTLKDDAAAFVEAGAEWTLAHVVFGSGTDNSFVVESGAKLTLTLGTRAVFADSGTETGGKVKIANVSDLTFSLDESVVPAGAGTVTVGLFSWTEDTEAVTRDVIEIVVGSETLTDADETALNAAFGEVSVVGNGAEARITSKVFKKNVNSLLGTTTISAVLTFIPEPSAFGLFAGLGALAFTAMRRRRRK
ncbi:MAG: PEP-CTERM sorting domain-containing protein [Candidatus Spyradosoma sp.]